MPEIVFDCCVLSNFAFADSLSLLQVLYGGRAVMTGFVGAEIMRGVQAGHRELARVQDAVKAGRLAEVSLGQGDERSLFERLSVSLGLGEASSIAVAKSTRLVFACDDKAARREAGLLGVKLTGTIGILKRAVREKLVSPKAGDRLLAVMRAHGYYAGVRSLRDIPD
jgi:predicted nucleic acid-binding protein